MKTYIYTLSDTTNNIRYVGKTINPKRRYQHHISEKAKCHTHLDRWIAVLRRLNVKPIMTIIDETEGDWQELEKYWIDKFKSLGFRLTNLTNGGEGSSGVSAHWNNVKVSVYDKDGNYIQSFDSLKACAEHYNTSPANVKATCRGKISLMLKKYQVRYGIDSSNIGKSKPRKQYQLTKKKNNE